MWDKRLEHACIFGFEGFLLWRIGPGGAAVVAHVDLGALFFALGVIDCKGKISCIGAWSVMLYCCCVFGENVCGWASTFELRGCGGFQGEGLQGVFGCGTAKVLL